MARITPSLSTRVDVRGKSEILLRFVGGRDHIYRLHSRLFVLPSRWKDGAVVIPRLETPEQKELRQLRDQLNDLVRFLLDAFQQADLSMVDRQWMQGAVDRFHHPEHDDVEDFFSLYSDFVRARDVGPQRLKRYSVVRGSLERFQAVRGQRLTIGSFTTETLEDYNDFLTNEHTLVTQKRYAHVYAGIERLPKPRGKNGVIDYFNVVRAFFNWLDTTGVKFQDPFKGFHIGTAVYGTPYFITMDELNRIRRANLGRHPSLEAQRDIFVFQCLVGCRVGDLVKMKKGDIVDGILSYIPRKTINDRAYVVRVPLNQVAMDIVRRYEGFKGEQLMPFISKQKYNDAIKRIFLAARVTRQVVVLDPLTRKEVKRPLNEIASSHIARRTFIGNLYKQVSDPNLIGSMSGHIDGSAAFARYRSIDDEMKAGLVEMLNME